MSNPPEHEVVVLGGGPAGCAAATLLARRSHKVALVRPSSPPAAALAESIPPSARKLFDELGLLGAIEEAAFLPNTGNTVWWAGREARSEVFQEGEAGVHADRVGLERVLVAAAESVGVHVYDGTTARSATEEEGGWCVRCQLGDGADVEVRASWVLDATGRHGLLARREGRIADRSTTTLALVRRFRGGAWGDARGTDTLVESYRDGWAWSVPVAEDVRCVTAMVDQRHAELEGVDVGHMLAGELSKTAHLGPALEPAAAAGDAWACPASLYASERYGRAGLLLVGDAGSFIDPLSSYGVKKALSSGWLAGVVAHTALIEPPMTETAVGFFDRRERDVYRSYRRVSADFFEEAAAHYGHTYWTARAEAARDAGGPGSGGETGDDPLFSAVPEAEVRVAFDVIRARDRLAARPAPTLRAFERAAVRGHRIVLADHLASDRFQDGLRYVRGVDLKALVDVAPRHDDVADGWVSYNQVASPVTLPDYLTALSTAFAAGFLVHGDA